MKLFKLGTKCIFKNMLKYISQIGAKLISNRGIGKNCLKSHFPIFYEMGKGVKY